MLTHPGSLLIVAQYLDSAYPAGGFAHSWGLETAMADGWVVSARDLETACRTLLIHQVARTDAVAAAACVRATKAQDLDGFAAVDRRLSITRTARESREASVRMGRRLLETAAAAEDDAWLTGLLDQVRAGRTPGNHASVLGAVLGRLGLSPTDAATLVLWAAANGCLSAGPRLLRITHDDVQRALVKLRPLCVSLAQPAAHADPLEMAAGAPLAEIWAMRHEVSPVRLFAS